MTKTCTKSRAHRRDRRRKLRAWQQQQIQPVGFTIAETCAAGGFGRTKAYEAIAAGRLKARKLGRRTIILSDDLRDFLQALPTAK
jgi:hypothetical protein